MTLRFASPGFAFKAMALAAVAVATSAILPMSAQAQSAEALDCPREQVTPGTKSLIFRDLTGKTTESESVDVVEAVVEITNTCVAKHNIVENASDAFGEYVFATIAMDLGTRELSAAGFDMAEVDRVLDVGPGARNSSEVEFSEPLVIELIEAALPADADLDAMSEDVWAMLGVYAAAAADYHSYREGR